MKKSVPEPAPMPKGEIVPDKLISIIEKMDRFCVNPEVSKELLKLIELVKERSAFGIEKYGQPLYSEDGRNGFEDARQELGDLLQYACKVRMCTSAGSAQEIQDFLKLVKTALVVINYIFM